MNQIIESLFRRKSVRVFAPTPLTCQEQSLILESACQAPTAGNQQLYTILTITDPAKKARLADLCDHQPFIATAPLVLLFLADCQKWLDAFRYGGCQPRMPGMGDLMLAVSDALIAAQNGVVAAESLGIGSCYIGDIMENREEVISLLNLPQYVFPAAMVVFGRPTPQQKARKKPARRAMKHMVHENSYRRMEAEELMEMLGDCAGEQPYAQWLDAFCRRKYNSDFSREMTRSVRDYCDPFWKNSSL